MFLRLIPSLLLLHPVLGQSFLDNVRFKVVLDNLIPDFSPLRSLCLSSCSSCQDTLPVLLCRVCCPDLASSPIAMNDVARESFSSMVFTDWLSTSFWLAGLRIVFQGWEDPAENIMGVTRELVDLINGFHGPSDEEESPEREEEERTPMKIEYNVENLARLSSSDLCGYHVSGGRKEKMVGGTDVGQLGLYPWQLSLATGHFGVWYNHRCGASVLSRSWVLTAAHCVDSLDSDLYVMGGFLQMDMKETAQIRLVDWYVYHEDFHPVLYEQDIALLHLAEPLVFTTHLLPICLPAPTSHREDKAAVLAGKTAVLTGWGRQWDKGPLATQLEMVELPVISNYDCEDWYNSTGSRQYLPDTFMCAGWREGSRDACSGDSGGPLSVLRDDGRVEVIGLVSWGIGCGTAGRPGVYTRISEFTDWIDDVIKEYEEEVEQEEPGSEEEYW